MREAIGYTAFLVSMAAVYAGAAEPMLRNVPGFDPGLCGARGLYSFVSRPMEGAHRAYVNWPGDRVVLYYDAGPLRGQRDPRGEHNPYMTLTANVRMRCY